MEIGYKYHPRKSTKIIPSDAHWLTLPVFKFAQGKSQDYLSQVSSLAESYKLHGHPLIDKRAHPMVDYSADMISFLSGVISGYENVVDAWDVCNETNGYNYDTWGEYWQLKMFEFMRSACPNASLWLNEYAIQNESYWDDVFKLAQKLSEEGLVDGVGIQCRADIREKLPKNRALDYGLSRLLEPLPAPKLTKAISAISAIGLKVHLSEVICFHDESQTEAATAIINRYTQTGAAAGIDRITYW